MTAPRKPKPEKPKAKRGRPTTYTDKTAAAICARLVAGESVREICADEDMPGQRTVYQWLAANEAFVQQYALAREQQAEHMAAEIMEIADDGTNDWMERRDKEGTVTGYEVNGEAIQRSRLRVDTRKWLMSKLLPKKYGDKLQTEVSGSLTLEAIRKEDTDALARSLEGVLTRRGLGPDLAREIVRAAIEDRTGEAGE